jgi:hypothetical protein
VCSISWKSTKEGVRKSSYRKRHYCNKKSLYFEKCKEENFPVKNEQYVLKYVEYSLCDLSRVYKESDITWVLGKYTGMRNSEGWSKRHLNGIWTAIWNLAEDNHWDDKKHDILKKKKKKKKRARRQSWWLQIFKKIGKVSVQSASTQIIHNFKSFLERD